MAVSSMRDIKSRIRSVESTRQITKAMELVASSKLMRARQRRETSQAFFSLLHETIRDILRAFPEKSSPYIRESASLPALFIVIGGDRGLAGGYNGGILRLVAQKTAALSALGQESFYFPLGKKMIEAYAGTGKALDTGCEKVENVYTGTCRAFGETVVHGFCKRQYGTVYLVYTKFRSVLSQEPVMEQILPLSVPERAPHAVQLPIYEPDPGQVLDAILPQYVGGLIYGAVCESVASECAARRTAMDSATKNADAMLDSLSLQYNRARQAAITQEITEIVSGADAL